MVGNFNFLDFSKFSTIIIFYYEQNPTNVVIFLKKIFLPYLVLETVATPCWQVEADVGVKPFIVAQFIHLLGWVG